jgi:hypothetical protein
MARLGILTAVAFLGAITSARADEQVWIMQSWPGDIDLIPCSKWSKSSDGTWVLDGAVKLGSETMSNIGVRGDAAAHKLDRECGAKTDNKTEKTNKTDKTGKSKKKGSSAD